MVVIVRNLIILFFIEKQKTGCLEKIITKIFFLKYHENTFRIAQKKCLILNKYSIEKIVYNIKELFFWFWKRSFAQRSVDYSANLYRLIHDKP